MRTKQVRKKDKGKYEDEVDNKDQDKNKDEEEDEDEDEDEDGDEDGLLSLQLCRRRWSRWSASANLNPIPMDQLQ